VPKAIRSLDELKIPEARKEEILADEARQYGVTVNTVRAVYADVQDYLNQEGISREEYDQALLEAFQKAVVDHPVIEVRGKTYDISELINERLERVSRRQSLGGGKSFNINSRMLSAAMGCEWHEGLEPVEHD
jgi:hypothetical protein